MISIGDGAFEWCWSLIDITIPNSVISIGDNAFGYCDSLESITIPNSVTFIGNGAFYSCNSLKSITIPNSVTSIGNSTFGYCDSLEDIAIPYSVTSIGDSAFEWCDALTDVYYSGEQSDWEKIKIGNNNVRLIYVQLHCIIPATIAVQPTNAIAGNGEKVSTKITAVGDELTYQWYTCEPGKTTFSKSSVTRSTYEATMTAAKSGRKVYCIVTDKYGNTVKSKEVTLSLLEITQQPVSAEALNGELVSVTIEAQGDDVTYQWWIKNKGDSVYTKSSITTDTYSAVMDESRDGRIIRCVVKDKYGNLVRSDIVTISMKAPAELKITQQPKSASAANGEYVSVTVKAQGDGVTYQWWIKNKGDSSYTKSSITSGTYTTNMTEAKDGRILRCVIKDKYGNLVRSDIVTISMEAPAELKITQQPVSASAANGEYVSVTVKAQGDGVTYQWWIKNPGDSSYTKSSIKSDTYTTNMTEAKDGRILRCVIKDKYGNLVRSDIVTITMS